MGNNEESCTTTWTKSKKQWMEVSGLLHTPAVLQLKKYFMASIGRREKLLSLQEIESRCLDHLPRGLYRMTSPGSHIKMKLCGLHSFAL